MSNDPNGASLGTAQGNLTINSDGMTAAVAKTVDAAKQMTDSMAQMGQSADDNAAQATTALEGMQAQAESLGDAIDSISARGLTSIGRLASVVGDPGLGKGLIVAAEIDRAVQGFDRLTESLGKVGLSLTNVSGLFGAAATQGAELATATGVVSAGMGALLAVLLPIVPVGVALVEGFQYIKENMDAVAPLLTEATSQLNTYFKAIQDGTTASIEAELKKLQTEKDAADQELAIRKNAQDAAFAAAQQSAGDLAARIEFAFAGTNSAFKAFQDGTDKLAASSTDLTGQIAGLNEALGATQVAANDAAKALDAQANANLQFLDKQAQYQLESETLIREGTTKSVQAKIAAMNDEINANDIHIKAINDSSAKNDASSKQVDALKATNQQLQAEADDLAANVLPLVQAREAWTATDHQAVVDAESNATIEADINKLMQDADVKKLDARKAALQESLNINEDEISALQNTPGGVNPEIQAKMDALKQTDSDLTYEIGLLDDNFRATVQAAQDVKTGIKDFATGLTDSFKSAEQAASQLNAEMLKMTAIQDQEAKLTQSYTDAKTAAQTAENLKLSDEQTAYDTKTLREKQDFYQKQSDADAKFYDQQAVKSRDFYEKADTAQSAENTKIGEETEAFNLQQARRAQDFGAQLVQIEENTRTSVATAAGRLDAVGVQNALDNGQKQVDAATDTYNKTRDRAQQDFQIKIQDEQDQFTTTRDQQLQAFLQQQQDALDNYDTQRSQAQDAFNIRLDREQQDFVTRQNQETQAFNDQQSARATAYNQQLTALQAQQAAEAQIIADSPVVSAFQTLMNNIASAAAGTVSNAATTSSAVTETSVPGLTSYSDINLPSYDLGTNGLGATMPVLAHANEAIVNPSASVAFAKAGIDLQAGPGAIGGKSFTFGDIYVSGVNTDGSNFKQQLQQAFEEMAL